MKKKIVLLSFCLCIAMLTGCIGKVEATPPNMSEKETVMYYFEKYNEKDFEERESVVFQKTRGQKLDLDRLNYIKLIDCEIEPDKDKINFEKNRKAIKDPYDVALLYVKFEINYREDSAGHLPNGIYQWEYYLAKETEHSDWRIVRW